MNSIKAIILIIAFANCTNGSQEIKPEYKKLIGCWNLNNTNSLVYPSICFRPDSSVTFSSKADTSYNFKFKTLGSNIGLTDQFGTVHNFPILYFGSDSLVIKDIMISQKVLIYKKTRM